MSDDLRDAFGEDIFMEPEEEDEVFEEETGEAQNKTFLIAAAVLGGLLFLAIGVFILWALVLNPRMQAQQAAQNANIQATNTAIVKQNGEAESAEEEMEGEGEASETETPEPEDTEEPTATPSPTPVIKPTNTPTSVPAEEEGEAEDEEEVAGAETEATETPEPRRTATPTRTPRATPTPEEVGSSTETGSTTDATPETGLGEALLVIVAAFLLGLIIFARRLRKA